MKIEIKERFKVLTPDEGKILTNGEVFSYEVTMPLNGDESAWWDTDIPPEPETDDEETEQDNNSNQ